MNSSSASLRAVNNTVTGNVINDIDKIILELQGLSSVSSTQPIGTDSIDCYSMSGNYGKRTDIKLIVDKPIQRTQSVQVDPGDITRDCGDVWTRDFKALNTTKTGAIGLEYLQRDATYTNNAQDELNLERFAQLVALTEGLRLRDHCEFCHIGDDDDRTYCSIYERYVDAALEGAYDTFEYDSTSCDEMEYDLETYEQYEADYDRDLNTWTTYSLVHIDTHSIFSDDYELELERLDDVGGLEASYDMLLNKPNDDLLNDNVLKSPSTCESVKNVDNLMTYNNLNVMTSCVNSTVTPPIDNNELKVEKNIANLQTFNEFYEKNDKKSYEKILNFNNSDQQADLINYNS